MKASLSENEHVCSFDDLLSKQRSALRSRVDSLRSSVEEFDEKCRNHLMRSRQRRRSDGDFSLLGRHCDHGLFVSQNAEVGADWGTTSGSDTDESVIEFCSASQKLRQARGTQTKSSMPDYLCSHQSRALNHVDSSYSRVSVCDVATQTTHGDAFGNLDLISISCRENINRQQLLDVFEVLAMQRPTNGQHKSLVKKTASCSPLNIKSKHKNISSWSSNSQKNKFKLSRHTSGDVNHNTVLRHESAQKDKTELASGLQKREEAYSQASNKVLHYSHRAINAKLEECGCRGNNDGALIVVDSLGDDTGVGLHDEDDLWRLAEEGRLPWTCTLIQFPLVESYQDPDCIENFPAKLFYRNETDSLFGPVRLFRRCKRQQRRWRPPWKLISIPPNLAVIQEH